MNFDTSVALFQHLLAIDEQSMSNNLSKLINKEHPFYDEVAELISAHEQNQKQTSFNELIGKQAEQLVEDSKVHQLVNSQVGVYQLVKKLGQGGMGAVYLGKRNDGQIEQTVAIKFLYPSIAALAGSNFLLNEAQHLANLKHSNIAKIQTVGITNQGLSYMVMEYIEGEPIDQYCDNHKLQLTERLILFQKVCQAVREAHQNMIIHADLKPSNILVDTQGEPKLLDFGIARQLNKPFEKHSNHSVGANLKAASGDFASPEQKAGTPLSAASDIFSAGKILERMINPPEKPKSLIAIWCKQTVNMCLQQQPSKRLSSFDVVIKGIENILNYYPPNWVKCSYLDKINAFVVRNTFFSISLFLFLLISCAFLSALITQNQQLDKQNKTNEKVITFLTSLFANNKDGDEIDVFNLLETGKPTPLNSQLLTEKGKQGPFIPFVFTNHSVKINELIKLKVVAQSVSNQPYTYTIKGLGSISSSGKLEVMFNKAGLQQVSIIAHSNSNTFRLDLNFIVRDDHKSPILFTDVAPTDQDFGDIHYLALKGILIGRPTETRSARLFQPEQYVKQAEALKIIMLAAHQRNILKLKPSHSNYPNLMIANAKGGIEDFSWASTFLDAAINLKIVEAPRMFSPKQLTSRIWLANVLVKTLKLINPKLLLSAELRFVDKGNFNSQHQHDTAATAAFYNLLGQLDSAFLPQTPMTRREVAVIAAKILQLPVVNEITEQQKSLLLRNKGLAYSGQLPNLQTPAYRRIGNDIIALDSDAPSRTKIEFTTTLDKQMVVVMSNQDGKVKNSFSIPID